MNGKKLLVSVSPHLQHTEDTSRIMWTVNLSLIPAAAASIYLFGLRSLLVIATSILASVAVEALAQRAFKKNVTVSDGSAFVTGLLLAFNLPPTAPLWMVAIGAVVAIFLVKQLFGGLGYNIFNPALAARAVLLTSWPAQMSTWTRPLNTFLGSAAATATFSWRADAVTAASALSVVKEAVKSGKAVEYPFGYMDLFLGNVPGSLGETSKAALLLGALFLILRGIVNWRTPVFFIATVAVLSLPFGRDPLAEVLSGGLLLGAFFMATDMVTGPTTRKGRVIFGIGCGLITALIRSYGGFPEGVSYSILFMNCLNPLIEKNVRPRIFGTQKSEEGS